MKDSHPFLLNLRGMNADPKRAFSFVRVAIRILWGVSCLVMASTPVLAAGDVLDALLTSEFLINFGDGSTYATDGIRTWQSFDLSSSSGGGIPGNLNTLTGVTLRDVYGENMKGITLSVSPNPSANGNVGNQDAAQVLEAFFSANRFSWFNPAVADQRSTHSIGHNTGAYVFTFSGFRTDDVVDVEFVLGRSKTGDRAVTISRSAAGDIAHDVQVGTDAGPAYPTVAGLTGATSYSFTLTSTGSAWACLPNAMRVRVMHPATTPGVYGRITFPTAAATLYPDQLLTVSVAADAIGTTVREVEVFVDGVSIGVDSSSPYEFVQGYPDEGTFTLRAVITGENDVAVIHEVPVVVASVFDRTWTRHTLDTGLDGADGVRSADVDADGDQDLIVGWEEAGVVRVYENPGPTREALTTPWNVVSFTNGLASVEDAALADLDGDGRLDMIASTEGGNRNLVIYWAPDPDKEYWDATNWTRMTLTPASGEQWMFSRTLDVDGDGRMDIVAGSKNSGASVSWIKSPANPRVASGWVKHRITDAGWIMSLELEDMDGDGDLDILISDRQPGGGAQGVRWLSNPGGQHPQLTSPWTSHMIAAAGEDVMFLDVADLDGDGFRDIVVPVLENGSAPNEWILLRRLDASGLQWQTNRRTFPAGTAESKALRIADVNGDQQLDVVAFFGDALAPLTGGIWLEYQNNPFSGTWVPHPLAGEPGEKFDLVLTIDLDGDGDLDVIETDEDENGDETGLGLVVYENPTILDRDGDGVEDRKEFRTGTNPLSAANLLAITALQIDAAGQVTVEWNSDQSGSENPTLLLYRVMYADGPYTDLSAWNELEDAIPSSGTGTNFILDQLPVSGAVQRSYRIEIDQTP